MGPDEAHHLRAIVLRRRSDCCTAALLACERVDTGPNQTPHGHFGVRRIAVRVTALRSVGASGFFSSAQRARRLLLECGAVHPVAWMIPLPVESVHFAVDTLPRGLDDARSDSFVGRHGRTLVDLTREVTGVVAVYLAYQRGRILARDQAAEAFANARRVIDFERRLHLFSERTVQSLSMHYDGVMWLLNHYYARVHFPLTTAFVIWLFFRHRETYGWVRTWLISVTMIALVIHVAFPLAPPRMLGSHGFIDTLRLDGLHIYSVDPHQSLANQFAAMPSLHFGWALIIAIAFIAARRTPWSVVALAHPAITLVAIVATANHYWIDAAVALLVVTGALVIVRTIHLRRAGRQQIRGAAESSAKLADC